MSDLFPDAPKDDEAPFPWQRRQWDALLSKYDNGQLAHAYLVCGDSGLGKHEFALAFARYLLCLEPLDGRACGQCSNCLSGGTRFHPDIMVLHSEEESRDIKVDQVRELGDFLQQTSHSGRAKIVVMEDAHRMNTSSANALLKTLEEPSANSYLFLVTDMPGMLMATIRSRCQRLLIHAPEWEQGKDWLLRIKHDLVEELGEAGISSLWQEAGGRPLRLLQMLEQDYLSKRQEFEQVLCQLAQGRLSLVEAVNRVARQGEAAVLQHLHRLSTILIKYRATAELPAGASEELEFLAQAVSGREADGSKSLQSLLDFYQELSRADRQLAGSTNPNPRLLLESLLHRWSQLARVA